MILAALNQDDRESLKFLEVHEGQQVRVGRRPVSLEGESVELLTIPWNDRLVSRNHFSATCRGNELILERLPALPGRSAPNALYSNAASRDREQIEEPHHLKIGESFCIGVKGATSFFWLNSIKDLDNALDEQDAILELEMDGLSPRKDNIVDYDQLELLDEYSLRLQLKLLQRELPEQVLSGWTNEEDLFSRAALFLGNALPGQKGVSAGYVAVSKIGEEIDYELLNRDPTERADFRPSRTLLSQMNLDSPTKEDVMVWNSKDDQRVFRVSSLGSEADWVAIIPVAAMDEKAEVYRNEEGRPVYQYVLVRRATETAAASFVPFLRLIASLTASLLQARQDQRVQDRISTYFSPALRSMMGKGDSSEFDPAMVDCTVMFVDRRGSSRVLEKAKTDEEILDRLDENQEIVGLITEQIFDHEGVITDFAGDGALALWGWPNWVETKRAHARLSVETAEQILLQLSDRTEYEEEHGRFMSPVRIGISTGRLAVGKTGPSQQWHISVFGSVANLGARLERIAKEFKVPLLISAETRDRLAADNRIEEEGRLLRKLCYIQPAGFKESYPIFELVQSKELGGSGVSKEDVMTYERALEFFVKRQWQDCLNLLKTIPEDDKPTQWLVQKTRRFEKHPPDDSWTGEIPSLSK